MKQMLQISSAIVTLIILLLAASPAQASSGVTWTKSYYLSQGQGVMSEIQMDCGAQLILQSPYGSNYDIYAMRNYGGVGSCPSNSYIMTHYDKITTSNGRTSYIYLEPGLWCVLVQARYGSGNYVLTASSECSNPPAPQNPCYGDPCCGDPCCGGPMLWRNMPAILQPYKTSSRTGYLNAGQSQTYGYQIGGERTYIEWILTGPCGNEIPIVMMSADQVSSMRRSYCGPDFDLYIYKDCNPRYSRCSANYADIKTGSDAYVGVQYPSTGSIYYAQVYAKSGSGSYTLTCRSYTCSNDVIMMMSNPDSTRMMYTATSVTPPGSIQMMDVSTDGPVS